MGRPADDVTEDNQGLHQESDGVGLAVRFDEPDELTDQAMIDGWVGLSRWLGERRLGRCISLDGRPSVVEHVAVGSRLFQRIIDLVFKILIYPRRHATRVILVAQKPQGIFPR